MVPTTVKGSCSISSALQKALAGFDLAAWHLAQSKKTILQRNAKEPWALIGFPGCCMLTWKAWAKVKATTQTTHATLGFRVASNFVLGKELRRTWMMKMQPTRRRQSSWLSREGVECFRLYLGSLTRRVLVFRLLICLRTLGKTAGIGLQAPNLIRFLNYLVPGFVLPFDWDALSVHGGLGHHRCPPAQLHML